MWSAHRAAPCEISLHFYPASMAWNQRRITNKQGPSTASRILTPAGWRARRNAEQVVMMMVMTRMEHAAWACSMRA